MQKKSINLKNLLVLVLVCKYELSELSDFEIVAATTIQCKSVVLPAVEKFVVIVMREGFGHI